MLVHSKRKAQIKVQIKALLFNKALTKVLAEYFNYNNIFLAENVVKLQKKTEINEHIIKLEEGKQPLFGPIYSLGPVELETLKIYIKTNLASDFIRLSKSSTKAPIFFDRKPNRNLHLCVNYWDLNNLTIKNQYLLLLIGELFNQLGQAK